MSDEGKRFVLRAPQAADPSKAPQTPAPPEQADPPEMNLPPIGGMSGVLPPVTISEIKAPPPATPSASQPAGLGMLGAGCIMMCLFPTLPWFGIALVSLPQTQRSTGIDIPTLAGIRTWAGLACLLGGIATTSLLILMLLPNWQRKRETLGLFAGGIGAIVGLIGVYSIAFAPSVAGFALGAETTVWVALTAVGGFVAAVGGFLVRD